MRRRAGHDVFVLILAGILMVFAVAAAVACLIAHVLILAGVALLIGLAFHLGRHGRRQATGTISSSRPDQGQTAAPVPVDDALPAATMAAPAMPVADDWDEQRPAGQADRGRLLADPRSGVRPLTSPWGPSSRSTILNRLKRGWSDEAALSQPVRKLLP